MLARTTTQLARLQSRTRLSMSVTASMAGQRKSFHSPFASPFAFLSQQQQQGTSASSPSTSTQVSSQALEAQDSSSFQSSAEETSRLHVVCDTVPIGNWGTGETARLASAVPLGAYPVSEPYAQ